MKVKFNPNPFRMTEKHIEKAILEFLRVKGIFCWKQNTVGVYDAAKGIYRAPMSPFIIKGVADILAVQPKTGRLIAIECKMPERRNNLTQYQTEFLKNINESGGIAFVATGVSDVAEKLDLPWRL